MPGRELVLYGDPVLRRKADPVPTFDDELRALADDMVRIMYEEQGIGLAAPQVGISRRLFVLDVPVEEGEEPLCFTLVNPEIVERTGSSTDEEGCLSVPGIREKVTRPARVVVHYEDVDGTSYELEADGLLARAIQHENDHLDGVLFFDRISSMRRTLLKKRLADIAAGKVPKESERP